MALCCPEEEKDCRSPANCSCEQIPTAGFKADFPMAGLDEAPCCGGRPSQIQGAIEKPGYRLLGFVDDFMETAAGSIPRVSTQLSRADRLGGLGARLGVSRNNYRIAPGLYGVGKPHAHAPVLVSANYKLSFDILRSHLEGIDAWIMVLDTRGINVWCAAGKGTFCALEVVERVQTTGIEKVVAHRRLILPQLAAAGVAARKVKSMCGFEVVWGPVHAKQIGAFLAADLKTTPAMRKVTFTLRERVELIPVELNHLGKPTLYVLPALFLLSGLGPGFFSIGAAVSRGLSAFAGYLLAVAAGTILAPAFLPWLPGSAFAIKGAAIGAAASAVLSVGLNGQLAHIEMLALTLFIMAVSSYLAMNFTGSTPFTSPTGVEKEMRKAIPAQIIAILLAIFLWIGAGFSGA